jgi:hypothetical protein
VIVRSHPVVAAASFRPPQQKRVNARLSPKAASRNPAADSERATGFRVRAIARPGMTAGNHVRIKSAHEERRVYFFIT